MNFLERGERLLLWVGKSRWELDGLESVPAPFFVEPSSPRRSCQPATPCWETQGDCNNGSDGSFIGVRGF